MNMRNEEEMSPVQGLSPGRSICVVCGEEFVPAFRHPQQQCCKCSPCIRKRAAERQRKSVARHRHDREYRRKTARRKHEEYMRRKVRKASQPPEPLTPSKPPSKPPAKPSRSTITPHNLDAFFLGLISYATGTTDAEELNRLCGRCYEIGRNVHLRL